MNGIKFLLDTNFILGLLKSHPEVLAAISLRNLSVSECGYSAITVTYLPLTRAIEDVVIGLRQTRKIKLPDAVIAATAICAGVELLTLDQHLLSVVQTKGQLGTDRHGELAMTAASAIRRVLPSC